MKKVQEFIEEDGAWLSKTAAAASLGTSTYNFIKNQAGLYKQRPNNIRPHDVLRTIREDATRISG